MLQGGRRKAYRPASQETRQAALSAALAAWDRGDWFETHELLEPAWMGTADLAERLTYQGLIKIAAAFVHAARGNLAGVRVNLDGASGRLADAAAEGADVGAVLETLTDLRAAVSAESTALQALPVPDLRRLLEPSSVRPAGRAAGSAPGVPGLEPDGRTPSR